MRRLVTIITNPIRFNVKTFMGSHQMAVRYAYLATRFLIPPQSRQDPAPSAPKSRIPKCRPPPWQLLAPRGLLLRPRLPMPCRSFRRSPPRHPLFPEALRPPGGHGCRGLTPPPSRAVPRGRPTSCRFLSGGYHTDGKGRR